ncbi:MAG: hypothetical protein U9N72_02415 [Bacteroidota bacterium]|nr:hypothetical protein [Bacteroidota bacterium]
MKIVLNIIIAFVCTFLCSFTESKDQDDIHYNLAYTETQSPDTISFDLVVYGKGLQPGDIRVSLKSNPVFGDRWEVAGEGIEKIYHDSKLLILKELIKSRYLGQDIRENYISARLMNTGERQIMVSAVYALPSSDYNGANILSALSEAIEERPHEIKKHSLASHVRPHPLIIETGKSWTEHIEAPVKLLKPGLREVEWLDILFADAKREDKVPADNEASHRYPPAENMMEEWQEYIEEVVKRYPDIKYFEVWNEPNIDWFLRADENYKVYVDKILIPAAEIIHKYGRKVVGPSFTTEWPLDSWPAKKRPRKHAEKR